MSARPDLASVEDSPLPADSIAKGALSIGGGRLIGTVISFILLMLLTHRSQQDVGVFRVLATFLLIAESLPLLGMHRWLATQMGTEVVLRGRRYASACIWAATVALCIAATYLGIAALGIYDREISIGLVLIAFATVPSGVLLVEQSSLIGIGRSGKVGLLNLGETVARSTLSIALLLAGFDVLTVIAVFATTRWITAVLAFRMVSEEIGTLDWHRPYADLIALRSIVPRFAGMMVCFLTLRNAPLLMLPSLADSAQGGLFAVSYQLADLAMLMPTVLALSATFTMARGAVSSRAQLRGSMVAMVLLLSVLLFPIAAMSMALAEPLLALLFGPRFVAAAPVLQLMMFATAVMGIDQVLSQGMVSDQRYHDDLISVAVGAVAAIVLTFIGAGRWGAVGAAGAFVASMCLSTATRAWLMRDLRAGRVMVRAAWRPAIAALVGGVATAWANGHWRLSDDLRWSLLWTVPGALFCITCFVGLGGGTKRSRTRLLNFILRRG